MGGRRVGKVFAALRRFRWGLRFALVGIAVGAGAGVAGEAQAVETPRREVQPVACEESVVFTVSDMCQWQEASKQDKYDALADLLLWASVGVVMVGGYRVAL